MWGSLTGAGSFFSTVYMFGLVKEIDHRKRSEWDEMDYSMKQSHYDNRDRDDWDCDFDDYYSRYRKIDEVERAWMTALSF